MEMKVFPLMEVLAIGTQTTLRWRDPRKEVAASQLHSEKSPSAEKCRRREEDSIAGLGNEMVEVVAVSRMAEAGMTPVDWVT